MLLLLLHVERSVYNFAFLLQGVRLEEDICAISVVILDLDEISVLRTKSKKHY